MERDFERESAVVQLAQLEIDSFGKRLVPEWQVTPRVGRTEAEEGAINVAEISFHDQHRNALMTIHPRLADEEIVRTVRHELLHVALRELAAWALRTVNPHLPPKVFTQFEHDWEIAEDALIERMLRGFDGTRAVGSFGEVNGLSPVSKEDGRYTYGDGVREH